MAHDIYAGCCTCLSACKPRWKRLVDNIFPTESEDGLVRSNMAKLTFYAVSHNEKLDRIGGYLSKRLDRDVYRQRVGYVFIAMQALDELLLACHAQSLNLFVESFLKMVHKLLESNNTDLQILGTNSFVKFSNIEEDTPSYHRRYDFFISKFSSMCHNNSENMETRRKIRLAGLKGLQGVVRKTVSDDLQVNIWDKTHMDKIIPSFLFNMHEGFDMRDSPVQEQAEGKPEVLAETCLRDVMRRAAYANIHAVLKPVLRHLDLHEMWVPNDFAIKAFKVIMYSIQSQYRYVTPHFLLLHLDENMKNTPQIKRSMVGVLKETVAIAADGAVGPSVLEIFNSLLRHLRSSVDQRLSNQNGEQRSSQMMMYSEEMLFEEGIIDTIGVFASILPDYQKIEIMMFIMGKVPLPNRRSIREEDDNDTVVEMNEEGDILLQNRLLKSLLEVANQYSTVSLATTFPASFLQPLLNMSIVRSSEIRLVVQEIFHTLLDRHSNTKKLHRNCEISKDITEVGLTVEKASRQDILFMRKNGADIQWHIYENLTRPQNSTENFVALYCTLALLVVELGIEDILVDLIRLSLALQSLASDSESKLPSAHKCALHATIGRYFNLIGQLTAIPALCQHVWTVIEARQKSAPELLPPINIQTSNKQTLGSSLNLDNLPEEYLFSYEVITEALSSSGLDASRLAMPYVHEHNEPRPHSAADLGSIHIDLAESAQSSPTAARKQMQEQITFESLKRILISNAIDGNEPEDDRDKRLDILHSFQNSTLEELASAAEQKNERWQKKLNEILDMVINTPVTPAGSPTRPDPTAPLQLQSVPTYEMKFPELCVF
ncbi:protein EFR3 homolog B-like [Amphiura filiformis]|uniref:protein EFR3 homolog B-like n=1 Tax=Amphiura filiformis TaxID=82378 RepID=UPI003B2203D1